MYYMYYPYFSVTEQETFVSSFFFFFLFVRSTETIIQLYMYISMCSYSALILLLFCSYFACPLKHHYTINLVLQWNLSNADIIGTHLMCPDYRGDLFSGVGTLYHHYIIK